MKKNADACIRIKDISEKAQKPLLIPNQNRLHKVQLPKPDRIQMNARVCIQRDDKFQKT